MKFKLEKGDVNGEVLDNKEFLITILIFIASLVLFIVFILPNILDFPTKVSDRGEEIDKFNDIKTAQKVLESADQSALDEELDIVSIALPTEKNFELILGAISEAATRSNAQVKAYQFSQTSNRPVSAQGETTQELEFEIVILGDVEVASEFARELSSTYPISEIKEIKFSRDESEIIAVFYFKPITAVKVEDVALSRQKTDSEIKTLDEISKWNLFSLDESFIQQISSESANPF